MSRDITTVKVVVTGPFAAGKTTLISTISEIPVMTTETGVSDDTRSVKGNTTVTMDFGKLTVSDDDSVVELYLFGTPGQSRFDFMWEVLAKGMLGFILMVDVTKPETWSDANDILDWFTGASSVPFVVGANRAAGDDEAVERLRAHLGLGPEVQVVPCDAVQRSSTKEVLLALLVDVLGATEAAHADRG